MGVNPTLEERYREALFVIGEQSLQIRRLSAQITALARRPTRVPNRFVVRVPNPTPPPEEPHADNPNTP
jgi:hypothetical protein